MPSQTISEDIFDLDVREIVDSTEGMPLASAQQASDNLYTFYTTCIEAC